MQGWPWPAHEMAASMLMEWPRAWPPQTGSAVWNGNFHQPRLQDFRHKLVLLSTWLRFGAFRPAEVAIFSPQTGPSLQLGFGWQNTRCQESLSGNYFLWYTGNDWMSLVKLGLLCFKCEMHRKCSRYKSNILAADLALLLSPNWDPRRLAVTNYSSLHPIPVNPV